MRDAGGQTHFGEQLRRLRLAAGLSQEQLAERAGLSLAAVSSLERGIRRAPQRATFNALALALGLDGPERETLARALARARSRSAPRAEPVRNVPAFLTSFVARETELDTLVRLAASARLVSVVGPAGVGKTRLACEAAQRVGDHIDRVIFVDLAPLRDAGAVASRFAAAAGLGERGGQEAFEVLAGALRSQRTLLVVDNCEHLIEPVAHVVARLVRDVATAVVVATSRERLALTGETILRLDPLEVTADPAAPAVRLFVDRAKHVDPGFTLDPDRLADVVAICRQLDGLPLAIELAAARLDAFGLPGLRRRLGEHFALPGAFRDTPDRHATLASAIAWSFDALSNDERAVLRRASAFVDGFSLEAAEHVCSDDAVPASRVLSVLTQLVEKSLIGTHTGGAGVRYTMLVAVRTFAARRLEESGDAEPTMHRLTSWYVALADALLPRIHVFTEVSDVPEVQRALAEFQNVRALLERLLATPARENALFAARILGGMRGTWIVMDAHDEARLLAERILAQLEDPQDVTSVTPLLRLLVLTSRGDDEPSASRRALEAFERAGDVESKAVISITLIARLAETKDFRRATAMARDAERILADDAGLRQRYYGMLCMFRSALYARQGRYEEALTENLAAAEHGFGQSLARLFWRAMIEAGRGQYDEALRFYEVLWAQTKPVNTGWRAVVRAEMLVAAVAMRDRHRVHELAHEVAEVCAGGAAVILCETAYALPLAVALEGDLEAAITLRGFSERAMARYRWHKPPLAERLDDDLVERARSVLSASAYERAGVRGASMTALAFARSAAAALPALTPEYMPSHDSGA